MSPRPEVEEWPAARVERELADRARVLVLYYPPGQAASRAFLPLFDEAEAEACVPLARVATPGRRVPALVYYEHAEELERLEGLRGLGLSRRDLHEFLALVESIQEEPLLPKRMHGPRRG